MYEFIQNLKIQIKDNRRIAYFELINLKYPGR